MIPIRPWPSGQRVSTEPSIPKTRACLERGPSVDNYGMTYDQLIRLAQEAASKRRAAGEPVLPLAEAFYLDPDTARLLDALVGMGILESGDVPGTARGRSVAA